MDATAIEREVRRLAPWYYLWDLRGVRTDITPPCDASTHRVIAFPRVYDGFWRGKRVLDVGCNEGAFSFGAVEHGAAHVDAFDCRAINVEKGRFVASILGHDKVTFHCETTDSWIEKHGCERYDVVLMCGIINHLPDPRRAIREFCGLCDWVFVTCGVFGGEDGFTPIREEDLVSSSHEGEEALMPNTTETLVSEFVANGFRPVHIEETRQRRFHGGCCLLLKDVGKWANCRQESLESTAPATLEVHLVPWEVEDRAGRADPFDLHITVFNKSPQRRELEGRIRVRGEDGAVLWEASQSVVLQAWPVTRADPTSQSFHALAKFDLAGARTRAVVDVEFTDPALRRIAGASRLVVDRGVHC